MFVNIIKSYRDIVAVCDSGLIGKTFEEGNLQLEVKESFFKGKEVSKEEPEEIVEDMAMEDATFNFIGEEAVAIASGQGVISEEAVKKIQGVPFALVLL